MEVNDKVLFLDRGEGASTQHSRVVPSVVGSGKAHLPAVAVRHGVDGPVVAVTAVAGVAVSGGGGDQLP